MLSHTFEQTAQIITTTRNDDGDRLQTASKSIKCRFRWITELDRVSNREEIRSDALLWTDPDQPISEGTIIKADDNYFRVRRVTKARRLRGGKVHFLKYMLEKQSSGAFDD